MLKKVKTYIYILRSDSVKQREGGKDVYVIFVLNNKNLLTRCCQKCAYVDSVNILYSSIAFMITSNRTQKVGSRYDNSNMASFTF